MNLAPEKENAASACIITGKRVNCLHAILTAEMRELITGQSDFLSAQRKFEELRLCQL